MIAIFLKVVSGRKTFRTLQAENAVVSGNADIAFVNDVDVLDLNASLVYKRDLNDVLIRGHKILENGLIVDDLKVTKWFKCGVYEILLFNFLLAGLRCNPRSPAEKPRLLIEPGWSSERPFLEIGSNERSGLQLHQRETV